MATKLSEGDTVGITGEVTIVHADGSVTLRLHGYDIPITMRGENLSLIVKSRVPKRSTPLYDKR